MFCPVGLLAKKLTTLVSPGWTRTDFTSGSKPHGIPLLTRVINCTLMVREVSTLRIFAAACSFFVRPLNPVISQNTSYSGTSAKPKPNMPTTTKSKRRTTRALSARGAGFGVGLLVVMTTSPQVVFQRCGMAPVMVPSTLDLLHLPMVLLTLFLRHAHI